MGGPAQLQGSPQSHRAFHCKAYATSVKRIKHRLSASITNPQKGEKGLHVQFFILNSLLQGVGVIWEGSDQESLLNGCVKKHLQRRPPLPSAISTRCRPTFFNLSSTVAHTPSSHITCIKAQLMAHQPQGYPFQKAYLIASD